MHERIIAQRFTFCGSYSESFYICTQFFFQKSITITIFDRNSKKKPINSEIAQYGSKTGKTTAATSLHGVTTQKNKLPYRLRAEFFRYEKYDQKTAGNPV